MKTAISKLCALAGCMTTSLANSFIFSVLAFGLHLVAISSEAAEMGFLPTTTASPPPSGAKQLCLRYYWACISKQSVPLPGDEELQIIKQINRKINISTRTISDQSQYKTTEFWALPTSLGGDCEDIALLKKRDMIAAGVNPGKLLLATVLDSNRNAHAVLIYRSSQGDLVLDNLTNRVKHWSATRYFFLRLQDPEQPRNWVAVYSRG